MKSERACSGSFFLMSLAAWSCGALLYCANAADVTESTVSRTHGVGGGLGIDGGTGTTDGSSAGWTNTGRGGAPITLASTTGVRSPSGTCEPVSCHPTGGDYCGSVGNGCGNLMDCGICAKPGWVCEDGLCRGGSDCSSRASCKEGTVRYCGRIGNDCGGELDCGQCDLPETCGGTGTPNVCGDPNCPPISCDLPTGRYCGVIGDGCGRSMDCGTCPDGAACGGDGTPGVCPGSSLGLSCTGIRCQVAPCSGGTTSVSGVVYDPAGANPLYNVTVYIPNGPLDPIPTGATCEQCNAMLTGQPITTALTDASGRFRLEGVPTGSDIPMVMQVGRWRRKITIPKVEACKETVLSDRQLTRLPRNRSEGDIPHIAITTGGADALECLIPRIGLDLSEVTTDTGGGRIHLYAGGLPDNASGALGSGLAGLGGPMNSGRGATSMTPGGTLSHASTLWSSTAKMRGYDIVMFSCEGAEALPPKDSYLANFQDYVDNGGRAFLTHYHYYWLNHGSQAFQGTAKYTGDDIGKILASSAPVTGTINTAFPKGAALADWLVTTGASSTRGKLTIYESRNSVTTVNSPTQDWIYLPAAPNQTQYLTFNTPVGASTERQCGRVVFTDLHIGAAVTGQPAQGGDTSNPAAPFPEGCSQSPMSPQIKALEFIFFDLAACLMPDFETPRAPTAPPATLAAPPAAPVPPPPPPPVPR